MDLKDKIKSLPGLPGVYLMKDRMGGIIYVGKSKNLKNRVGSYFQKDSSRSPKVEKLVNHLKDFDYYITDTEFEAFLLECKLIKEIKPLYNKQMKSPMSYPYIMINMNDRFPFIEITDEANEGGLNLYFGPYNNKSTVEKGLLGIKECCRILCTSTFRRSSPCLNYSLGLCMGMCLENADMEHYYSILHKIACLLNGTDGSILQEMEQMMNSASERFDFENAMKYRDYIGAAKYLINSANIVRFTEENKNIAMLEYVSKEEFKLFIIKGSRVLFKEKYSAHSYEVKELKIILKDKILSCIRPEILADSFKIGRDEVDQAHIIYSYLKHNKKSCRHFIIPDSWISNRNKESIYEAVDMLLGIK